MDRSFSLHFKRWESFPLTISPKYIPAWGKWEAFRELMQNVIDRKNECNDAEIIFTYNPIQQRLCIGNKVSVLERKTLVLGETTKADDDNAIGKYGEGYKLALLVLIRLGARVRIRTGDEVWAPTIRMSEQFQTELLTIDVLKTKPTDSLLFEVDGITSDDYRTFQQNCLFINKPINTIETQFGEILLDENLRGKIFVEGLHVCTLHESEKLRYGYNIKAAYISLDRDRQKVSTYNVLWQIGWMWSSLSATYAKTIFTLMQEKWSDVSYYESHNRGKGNPLYEALCNLHFDDFIHTYGKQAVPVKNEEEAKLIKARYNDLVTIIVPEVKHQYITGGSSYYSSWISGVRPVEETPYSITEAFIKKHLTGELLDKFTSEFLPLTLNWQKRK